MRDLPRTEKQLREIPPFEFENWAVIALGGIPNKAQVGDMGIDGRIYPSALPKVPAAKTPANLISWTTGIRFRSSRGTRSAAPTSTSLKPP